MAVTEDSYEIKNYNCNGILKDFDFDWRIFGEEDLVVKVYDSDGNETTLPLTTGYTAAKAGNDWKSGGTITTVATYPSGYTLTIERAVARKQPADYVANDNFPAETHEAVMDRAIMIIQELQNLVDRMPRNPADDAAMDMTMPVQNSRKERYLYFDVDGKPTAAGQSLLGGITVTAPAETVLDDSTVEAMCDTLGALDINNDSLDDVPDGATYKKIPDVIANACQFEGTVTRYCSIPLVGFTEGVNGVKTKGIQVLLPSGAAASDFAYLPVKLHDGVNLSKLTAYIKSDGSITVTVSLKRSPLNSNSSETSLAACLSSNANITSIDDSITPWETIDNTAYKYYVKISLSGILTADGCVSGVEIEYQINDPLT